MAIDNAKNFAKVTVSLGYDDTATSIVLSAGHGLKLPAVSFNATWWNATDYPDPSDDPNVEIVRVTNISTDTLTVTRAQEGTAASTKNTAGKTYKMAAGPTAKLINADLGAVYQTTGPYLTTAMASNAVTLSNIRISAGTTSNLASAFTFSNSNGVSFGLNAGVITGSVDATSSLVGTSGISISTAGGTASILMTHSNVNGVTFGFSGGSVLTGSIAPLTAGMSNLGDTFGTTGLVSQQLVFVAAGNNRLSQSVDGNSATVSIVGVGPYVSTGGNTSGDIGLWHGLQQLQGSNNITLSVSTQSQTFSGVTRTNAFIRVMNDPAISQYDPFNNAPVSNSTLGQSTVYFVPFDIPYAISASRVNFFLSLTHTFSGAPPSTAWLALGYGLYSRMTGANSDRLSLATSYSLSYVSASASSSTRLSATHYIGLSNATSHSTSQYGTQSNTVSNYLVNSLAGYRAIALPCNMTLRPGRSWLAVSVQSASAGGSLVLGHSVLQHQFSNNIAYRAFGADSAASNASFYGASDGLGIYSAQTAAFPNSVPLTSDSIRGAPVMTLPYFNFSGIGTSTNIL